MKFEDAVKIVLELEGGVSDDSRDPGKLTKWGISSVYYPQVLDPSFTREDAVQIYHSDFWNAFQCDKLPHGLDLMFFDCAVNQTQQAKRMLQRSVKVTADGVIGPITLAAIRAVPSPLTLIKELAAQRAVAYARNPNVTTFGLGWYRRLIEITSQSILSP